MAEQGCAEEPLWVWICSFPSNALRLTKSAAEPRFATETSSVAEPGSAAEPRSDSGAGLPSKKLQSRRQRVWWTVSEEIIDTGCLLGSPAEDTSLTTVECTVVGVARVSPGMAWDGPLTLWPAVAVTQRKYFQQARDAYYVTVLEAHAIKDPTQLYHRRSSYRGQIAKIQLRPQSMLFEPYDGVSGAERLACPAMTDTVAALVGGTAAVADMLAVQLAKPFADMVLGGSCQQIVFLSRWNKLPWKSFPAAGWSSAMSGLHDPPALNIHAAEVPEQKQLDNIARCLAKWTPAILAASPADWRLVREEIESLVVWLEGASAAARRRCLENAAGSAAEPRVWSSEALLLYFRAAHLLKDGSKLPVAINLLSAAAAAECRASTSREQLLPADASRWPVSGRCGPGRSTLRRLAFAVDVAAMMLEKRIRARLPSQATYGWADSSPQGQRDWLLSKTCVLRADSDIAALFRAANALAISRSASSEAEGAAAEGLAAGSRRRRRVLDDSSSSSDSQAGPVVAAQGERRLHVEMLRLAFSARVLPPVAMGLRQTSLAHKCAAFTHSVALESPASLDSLRAELDSYVSFTTDLGTEVAMPDFRLGCLSS